MNFTSRFLDGVLDVVPCGIKQPREAEETVEETVGADERHLQQR